MKLRYADILSFLGHGILLMSWPTTVNFSVASTPATFYQVTLSERNVEKVLKKKNVKPHTLPHSINKEIQTSSRKKTTSTPKQDDAITKKKKNTKTKAYIISRINHKIKNNFIYPRLARRNGWEGKVMLSLFVNAEGSIENAHIKSCSGYRILDQSALRALLKIKHVKKPKEWFNINQQEIIIPVIYRLQEG